MSEPRQMAGASPWDEYFSRVYGDKRDILFGAANLQPLTLNLSAAGPLKDYQLQGDFIWIDPDSTGTIRLRFAMAQPRAITMKPNYRINKVPFKQLLIEWDAQADATVTIWTGWGVDILPSANDITNLSNILNPVPLDPEYARFFRFGDNETDDSEAFFGALSFGAAAGEYAHGQLWNPAASGVNIYLDAANLALSANDVLIGGMHNVMMATSVASVANKLNGGAAPAGQVRQESRVAPPANAQVYKSVLAGTDYYHPFAPPLKLPPGTGYTWWHGTSSLTLRVAYQWREVPV